MLLSNFPHAGSKLATIACTGVNFCVQLVAPGEASDLIGNGVVELNEYVQSIAAAATERSAKMLPLVARLDLFSFASSMQEFGKYILSVASATRLQPDRKLASAFGDSRLERVLCAK